ncbi:hypothetical protein BDP67DRAFT_49937 [Colletotrichum lupini]|nr:hypothetical protein BDP67DRAFT_49937 [Colletotrichum lupini]
MRRRSKQCADRTVLGSMKIYTLSELLPPCPASITRLAKAVIGETSLPWKLHPACFLQCMDSFCLLTLTTARDRVCRKCSAARPWSSSGSCQPGPKLATMNGGLFASITRTVLRKPQRCICIWQTDMSSHIVCPPPKTKDQRPKTKDQGAFASSLTPPRESPSRRNPPRLFFFCRSCPATCLFSRDMMEVVGRRSGDPLPVIFDVHHHFVTGLGGAVDSNDRIQTGRVAERHADEQRLECSWMPTTKSQAGFGR